jgi:hypothetical protein
MARRPKGRSAVLVVQVPEGWRPASANAVPPAATASRFYARRQPLGAALAIAEAYNRSRLPCNSFDGSWALCVVSSGQQLSVRRLART